MVDTRVRLVEENLLSQFELVAETPHVTRLPDEDVIAFHRDIDFPLFNFIGGARFAPGTGADRARELIAGFVARGHPFLWWATPSTITPDVDAALRASGIEPSPEPGMHRTLDGSIEPGDSPPGLVVKETAATPVFVDVMSRGFGFPDFVRAPLQAAFGDLPPAQVLHVLATLGGEPVACGSGFLSGPGLATLGIYNIATLPHARRRGIGRVVTGELMRLGREHGCTDAVLMASAMGRPTYDRLGFVEVCQTPQYVWMPGG
ncbi:MAG TPA: GNAT family N-acetyltransferase [Intrasporangium sp.]|nr:GNAT family N-acetyltransferase [Intrasporangium sp.]